MSNQAHKISTPSKYTFLMKNKKKYYPILSSQYNVQKNFQKYVIMPFSFTLYCVFDNTRSLLQNTELSINLFKLIEIDRK